MSSPHKDICPPQQGVHPPFLQYIKPLEKVGTGHHAVVLIDADILVYQACSGLEIEVLLGNSLTYVSDFHSILVCIDDMLQDMVDNMTVHFSHVIPAGTRVHLVFCFSDNKQTSIRKELCPTYKGTRQSVRKKPLGYFHVLDHLTGTGPVFNPRLYDTFHGTLAKMEGDDVLGILATSMINSQLKNTSVFVATEDKDLLTLALPVEQMDMRGRPRSSALKELAGKHNLPLPFSPMLFHMIQTVMGDRTDGYAGFRGYGEVKTLKFLSNAYAEYAGNAFDFTKNNAWKDWYEFMWNKIYLLGADIGMTEEEITLQARLAWITQHGIQPDQWTVENAATAIECAGGLEMDIYRFVEANTLLKD